MRTNPRLTLGAVGFVGVFAAVVAFGPRTEQPDRRPDIELDFEDFQRSTMVPATSAPSVIVQCADGSTIPVRPGAGAAMRRLHRGRSSGVEQVGHNAPVPPSPIWRGLGAVATTVQDKIDDLRRRREQAFNAGSPHAVERQHAKGKLLARERIEYLLDPGSFNELDLLARHRAEGSGLEERPYTDGVITGWGTVEGARCSCSPKTSPCSAGPSGRCSPRRSTR